MLSLRLGRLVKTYEKTGAPAVRLACGTAAGARGIALNIMLFALKLLAGLLSGSIAVTADAFNNLSDAGSSLITLIGFRLSGKRADPTHPFGHGRIEYVAGLIVSMMIILMGVELLKSSVEAIVSPEEVAFSTLTVGILIVSVLVKGYMWSYNRLLSAKLESSMMKAAAADSLSDAVSTGVVLAAMLLARATGLDADGWAGLLVSLFIIISGLGAARDTVNPFGHGRIEYVAGLIVSMMIILMGVELLKSSVEAIVSPEEVAFSTLTVGILIVSVLVKGYMWSYNRLLSAKLESSMMKAAAADSLSDAVSTGVVLAAMLLARATGLDADGWAGLLVSLFIIISGLGAARDTVNPLLGGPPDPTLVERIRREALQTRCVSGLHDLIVHDYGPGRRMISLHVEVPSDGDILLMHDEITLLEQRLKRDLDCEAVIHMDPVVAGDCRTTYLRSRVGDVLTQAIDPRIRLHDFRVEDRAGRVEVTFDVVVPYNVAGSEDELRRQIEHIVEGLDENFHAIATIDRG